MEKQVEQMLEKAKAMAEKTFNLSSQAVGSAGKSIGDAAQATKLRLRLFEQESMCETLYKEIGKLVYDIHSGVEAAPDAMDAQLEKLDAMHAEIDALRAQIAALRQQTVCPDCGRPCSREDAFCSSCGAPLDEPQTE